ncbi:MAG TPA: excinuclease ABC subunit A, partial [Flavobacteriaceae bacterium]|nr:excinuclease ABC subunit A [Flavobacteriaceae bacterium]
VHNLKNIDIKIPRNQLVVITGISGSGKSSLAFDTIYAEGQRRYIETFSAYARQFLGSLERPDVDKIDGLSPVIAIEQKTTNRSPRSTVGTITEIYDFLRLLFARIGDAYSYETNEKMVSYSDEQIHNLIMTDFKNQNINILAPVIKSRKGHYRELFEQIAKQGFLRVRVDGEIQEIEKGMRLDRYKTHDIEIVIDRLKVNVDKTEDQKLKGSVSSSVVKNKRLSEAINTAMYHGEDVLMVAVHKEKTARYFSRKLMCASSGIAYPKPEPNSFSFNSPKGACPKCNGLGIVNEVSFDKIFPNKKLSINNGGIAPIGETKNSWIFKQLKLIGERFKFTLDTPIEKISKKAINVILNGTTENFDLESKIMGVTHNYEIDFEGITNFITNQYKESTSTTIKRWAKGFMNENSCSSCNGSRLRVESLHYKINNKNISELAQMDIIHLAEWFKKIKLTNKQQIIGAEILKEINTRIQFLLDVGLDYLSLDRSSKTLSGGEAQRIRLATQIGSQLVGVLYILDEPSIGLHQRDNQKLINSLAHLRDIGNSVLVVEHDKEMMLEADYVIDIGPKAGKNGGEIISKGTPKELLKSKTLTADYLNGTKFFEIPKKRRKGNGKKIVLKGATGNNLKNVDLTIPLGKMICVT